MKNIENIQNKTVLVYGDYMIDKYIHGKVSRISPEAPVPVLEVKKKKNKLGGAGNVINNIITLGAKVIVIGCIGNDQDGSWIVNELKSKNIDTTYLGQSDEIKTISKTRLVSKNQQFLRYDEEIVKDIPEEYVNRIRKQIDDIMCKVDAVVISDYAKGAVTNEMCRFLIETSNKYNIPVVVDPKGKDYSKYKGATVCTPNVKELSVVSGIQIDDDISMDMAAQKCSDIDIKHLVLTRSEKGISVYSKDSKKREDFPAISRDVIDVTGAGDTVVATIALMLAIGVDIGDCCTMANMAASVVCSKFGAATVSLSELMSQIAYSGQFKLVSVNTAKYIVQSLKEKGKKVVFTNGCFDLLHAGHLSSFIQAKEFGDVLIVAVNSDASVKRLKGDKRPIISEQDRINMICALECVNYVILMEDDNPVNILKTVMPDITVKGKDWENKNIPEKQIVTEYGGEMKFIDLEQGLSTTQIISNIMEKY